jgi:hypothetical protein
VRFANDEKTISAGGAEEFPARLVTKNAEGLERMAGGNSDLFPFGSDGSAGFRIPARA